MATPSQVAGMLAALALLCAARAAAQDSCDQAAAARARGEWYDIWENDGPKEITHSDEFYTQGFRLGYDFAAGRAPAFLGAQARWLCRHLAGDDKSWTAGMFVGQQIFTPSDIGADAPLPQDRPYAAWLHAGERFMIRSPIDPRHTNYHVFELQIGTIGPDAQGEWVQSRFHELKNIEPPHGWDNQMRNELELFASYRFIQRRALRDDPARPLQIDLLPAYELGVGSLQDYVEPSLTLRLGSGLGDPPFGNLGVHKAGDAPARNCVTATGFLGLEECSAYARVSGRYVAHNVFLDGANWRDGPSVEREPFYYDWAVGFHLRWRPVEFSYEYVKRGPEFSPVPATARDAGGRHGYSSFNLRCREKLGWVCPLVVGGLVVALALQDQ